MLCQGLQPSKALDVIKVILSMPDIRPSSPIKGQAHKTSGVNSSPNDSSECEFSDA